MSPATTTASAWCVTAWSSSQPRNVSWCSSKLSPCKVRPRCQSDVWISLIVTPFAVTRGASAETPGRPDAAMMAKGYDNRAQARRPRRPSGGDDEHLAERPRLTCLVRRDDVGQAELVHGQLGQRPVGQRGGDVGRGTVEGLEGHPVQQDEPEYHVRGHAGADGQHRVGGFGRVGDDGRAGLGY